MIRETVNPAENHNKYSAFIDELEARRVEKRILAYIKKVIRNSPDGYCCVKQEVIRKALRVRKQAVTDGCRNIVERGELVRIPANNKNRKNPKYYYFLPDSELIGNSIKSSSSSGVKEKKEETIVLTKEREEGRTEAVEIEAGEIKLEPNFIGELEPDFMGVNSWQNLDRVSLIEKYLGAGLMITPLVERRKVPPKGWTKEYLRNLSKEELLNYFRQNPQANVGCWMPKNFVVVDADNLDEFYRTTGGEVWETLTVSSGRTEGGLHFWFRHNGTIGSGNGIRPDLDYKADGCLVVLPPSIHKSGAVYQWNNLVAPIEAPQLIKDLYDTRQNLKNNEPFAWVRPASGSASSYLTSKTVLKEKQRYKHLFPIGRRMRFRLDNEQLAAELSRLNKLYCQPPLNENRMRKLIKDVLSGANRKDFRSRDQNC